MDILALIKADVDKRKQMIAALDREGLVEWARMEFESIAGAKILNLGLCIRWLQTESPEDVLAAFTQNGQGYEALRQAAVELRSAGEALPESVATYLLDTALGVRKKPRRKKAITALPNRKEIGSGMRDSLIFEIVELIAECTDYFATTNEATGNDCACSIVADALEHVGEDHVTDIYWQKKREEAERAGRPES